jgi:uncharacterized protein (TIGR02996 family)
MPENDWFAASEWTSDGVTCAGVENVTACAALRPVAGTRRWAAFRLARSAHVGKPAVADRRGDELLAAIHADPDSDDARMVYADHLQERGDPRGEFIALQLARHRDGGEVTARERELLDGHRGLWTLPLLWVADKATIRFERGFLAACQVRERADLYKVIGDPIWSTVEDLVCDDAKLATHACMRALRRFGSWLPRVVADLAEADRDLGIEQLLGGHYLGDGNQPPIRRGLPIGDFEADWARIFPIGRLTRVRSVALATPRTPNYPIIRELLVSPFGNQLEWIEMFDEREYHLETWLAVVRDHASLRRVSFRGRGPSAVPMTADARLVIERGAGDKLALRLDVITAGVGGVDPYTMQTLTRMGHGVIRELVIACPARDIERARQWLDPLADQCGAWFDDVVVVVT